MVLDNTGCDADVSRLSDDSFSRGLQLVSAAYLPYSVLWSTEFAWTASDCHEARMQVNQGIVKSISSGDTVVLTAKTANKRIERVLHLAYVTAPRLRRDQGDEPYAFESREILRILVVGKVVQFEVIYTVDTPSGQREYGVVTTQEGLMLPHHSLAEGLVQLRDDTKRKAETETQTEILSKLEQQEAKAKADSKGIWSKQGGKLETKYDLPDTNSFAEEWKGKTINGTVEHVLAGDRMIVRLKISPEQHVQTLLLVAGIRAPGVKRSNSSDSKGVDAEPFGEEARLFFEDRLLQRNVTVKVVGISQQGQLVCTVHHPKGNMAEFILQSGLARCSDHHSTMLGSDMAKLREAEKHARDKKLALFQGHVAKTSPGDAEVVVAKIQGGDTIVVRSRNGTEKRIGLSSIRQPKQTDSKQGPYLAEAKEYLRRRLINKKVRMTVDGKKPASGEYEEREVATVLLNSQNIALQLVEAGYASVIRHRRDDDDRSPDYDDLLAAEKTAQEVKKGMWSDRPPTVKDPKDYVDFSESLQKARVQASVLQRQKKVPAVVDFVKGASRFTILIPRENAKLTFVLSCIRAPKSARNENDTSEPFGKEAHEYANRKCTQRDVEIDVEGTDKQGGFIGTMYVNRENFAKLLLEEGLATVHARSAEQSPQGPELFAAEKKAKDTRKGLWHDYEPDDEEKVAAAVGDLSIAEASNGTEAPPQPRKRDYRDVVITHVEPTTLRLKLQIIGTGTGALEELMDKFRTFHLSPSNKTSLPTPPKTGDMVAAKFSEDGSWYRARIRRNDREAKASETLYVDYGNEEKLPWTELRPLAPQFSVQTLKPQAQDAILAFLQWPTAKEYVADAYVYLNEQVNGKEMVASVEFIDTKDNGAMTVVLFPKDLDKGVTDSVNADVVEAGLAVVKRKLVGWERGHEGGEVLKELREREGVAKEGRVGGWEYGDFGGDDDA